MYIFFLFQACTLKRVQKHPLEGDALSQSDSTTYYEDLLSCSENSTDEGNITYPSNIYIVYIYTHLVLIFNKYISYMKNIFV